jgi:hypothetical protein
MTQIAVHLRDEQSSEQGRKYFIQFNFDQYGLMRQFPVRRTVLRGLWQLLRL